jgi:hypothetical protein
MLADTKNMCIRGGHAQYIFFMPAGAIPQHEGSTSAIAIPHRVKEMLLLNCISANAIFFSSVQFKVHNLKLTT